MEIVSQHQPEDPPAGNLPAIPRARMGSFFTSLADSLEPLLIDMFTNRRSDSVSLKINELLASAVQVQTAALSAIGALRPNDFPGEDRLLPSITIHHQIKLKALVSGYIDGRSGSDEVIPMVSRDILCEIWNDPEARAQQLEEFRMEIGELRKLDGWLGALGIDSDELRLG